MKNINVAIVGCGNRGAGNLSTILELDGVTITAVCDPYEDRHENAANTVEKKTGRRPFQTTDYHEIMGRPDVDVVLVFAAWEVHIAIAIAAMEAGHAVAMEVGGSHSLEECYALVDAWERTRVPFMFLENCCFGRTELLVQNMALDGLFGELVHCHGAYAHDLREEIVTGKEKRHYRLNEYIHYNCENYPTHELGPIAKLLGINRGNRMCRLVSVSSKAAGLKQYIEDRKDTIVNKSLIGQEFQQGDIVNTIITCANGETISLRLDTTLPRFYSREYTVRGTKGMYEDNTHSVFFDGGAEDYDTHKFYKENIGNARAYEDKYLPDYWKHITPEAIELGHGGMDFYQFEVFFDALRNHQPMPIDVYDAAAWMCITCLSAQSISGGNIPVEVPDFTRGAWKDRPALYI